MSTSGSKAILITAVLAAGGLCPYEASASPIAAFTQTNLVSDIPGLAAVTDKDLRNPWGVSFSPTSPFWVSDNATGLSTLYNGAGTKLGLVVTIPGASAGTGNPTGQVNNPTAAFNGDRFIFASEDGLITGWRVALGTTAEILFNNSSQHAVYKGLALATIGANTYLYAADFNNGRIDVFPSGGAPPLSGNFSDSGIPDGFSPFNIQKIGSQLYVMYALRNALTGDDVAGPGNGYVDVFNLDGAFAARLVSGGPLNSPWGIALAPTGFDSLGNDLLIGNFGDGTINAFTQTGAFLGTLAGIDGGILVNDGLWALTFGNGGSGGRPNSLYLTAGLNHEADGLFARIDAVPEPGTLTLTAVGVVAALRRRRRSAGPSFDH